MNEQQLKDHVSNCLGTIPPFTFVYDGFCYYVKVHVNAIEEAYKLQNYLDEFNTYTKVQTGGDLYTEWYWLEVFAVSSDKYPEISNIILMELT